MSLDIETLRELQDWMGPRFSSLETTVTDIQREMRDRDHATKGTTETIARQLVEVVTKLGHMNEKVGGLQEWREEEVERNRERDSVTNRIIGAIILLGALFPATVAVVLKFG